MGQGSALEYMVHRFRYSGSKRRAAACISMTSACAVKSCSVIDRFSDSRTVFPSPSTRIAPKGRLPCSTARLATSNERRRNASSRSSIPDALDNFSARVHAALTS